MKCLLHLPGCRGFAFVMSEWTFIGREGSKRLSDLCGERDEIVY